MPTLRDVVDLLHGWYPPDTADSLGRRRAGARRPGADASRKVMFAVDPTPRWPSEAAAWGADLLVVHHPLFLKPVHGFARDDPQGPHPGHAARRRVRAADRAHQRRPGGRRGVRGAGRGARAHRPAPLVAAGPAPLDKLTVYVPLDDAEAVRRRCAGRRRPARIGDYDTRRSRTPGEGRFRPLDGRQPDDRRGRAARGRRRGAHRGRARPREPARDVVAALLAAHPYEEPAYDVVELADPATAATGSGRIGDVEPTTLGEFARPVAAALPATAARRPGRPATRTGRYAGSRCAAEPATSCSTRCWRTDADVYVTSDLRHHPAGSSSSRTGRR